MTIRQEALAARLKPGPSETAQDTEGAEPRLVSARRRGAGRSSGMLADQGDKGESGARQAAIFPINQAQFPP